MRETAVTTAPDISRHLYVQMCSYKRNEVVVPTCLLSAYLGRHREVYLKPFSQLEVRSGVRQIERGSGVPFSNPFSTVRQTESFSEKCFFCGFSPNFNMVQQQYLYSIFYKQLYCSNYNITSNLRLKSQNTAKTPGHLMRHNPTRGSYLEDSKKH